MRAMRSDRFILLAAVALLGVGLTGCTAEAAQEDDRGSTSASGGSTASESGEQEAAAEVPDLSGEWVQSNSNSPESYQAATVTDGSIEVYWVSDGGQTKSLYWAGTFAAPTTPEPYSWESQNDTSKTDSAMLASGDPTKTFTYEQDVISYDVTALGTTVTVELERQ